MGYFSNGTEGICYEEQYCEKCYFGDKACAVWNAHLINNYDECNNAKSILHLLIPRDDNGRNLKCEMFVSVKEVTNEK